MIKLLEFLWNGCWHDWGDTPVRVVQWTLDGEKTGQRTHIFQCKKCKRFNERNQL